MLVHTLIYIRVNDSHSFAFLGLPPPFGLALAACWAGVFAFPPLLPINAMTLDISACFMPVSTV